MYKCRLTKNEYLFTHVENSLQYGFYVNNIHHIED
jgi:hypothetical protein